RYESARPSGVFTSTFELFMPPALHAGGAHPARLAADIYHWAHVSGIQDPHEPEPIGFWVTRSDDAEGVVVALHGELDVAAAPQLEKLLDEIRVQHHRRVMVDL